MEQKKIERLEICGLDKATVQRFAIEFAANSNNVKLTAAVMGIHLSKAKRLLQDPVVQMLIDEQMEQLSLRYATHKNRLISFLWEIAVEAKENKNYRTAMEATDRIKDIVYPEESAQGGPGPARSAINIHFGDRPAELPRPASSASLPQPVVVEGVP